MMGNCEDSRFDGRASTRIGCTNPENYKSGSLRVRAYKRKGYGEIRTLISRKQFLRDGAVFGASFRIKITLLWKRPRWRH